MKKAIIIVVAIAVAAMCAAGALAYHNNKIKEMRAKGAETLQSSVSLDDYSEEQQKEIKAILDTADKKIEEAEKQEQVDEAIEEATALIGDVKTLEQIRTEGADKLSGIVSMDDYREEQQKEIKKILDGAEKKMGEASSEEETDKIIKEAKKSVKGIKTDKELKAEEEAAAKAAAEAAAAAKKKSSGKKKSGSGGCVGDDAKNFY